MSSDLKMNILVRSYICNKRWRNRAIVIIEAAPLWLLSEFWNLSWNGISQHRLYIFFAEKGCSDWSFTFLTKEYITVTIAMTKIDCILKMKQLQATFRIKALTYASGPKCTLHTQQTRECGIACSFQLSFAPEGHQPDANPTSLSVNLASEKRWCLRILAVATCCKQPNSLLRMAFWGDGSIGRILLTGPWGPELRRTAAHM